MSNVKGLGATKVTSLIDAFTKPFLVGGLRQPEREKTAQEKQADKEAVTFAGDDMTDPTRSLELAVGNNDGNKRQMTDEVKGEDMVSGQVWHDPLDDEDDDKVAEEEPIAKRARIDTPIWNVRCDGNDPPNSIRSPNETSKEHSWRTIPLAIAGRIYSLLSIYSNGITFCYIVSVIPINSSSGPFVICDKHICYGEVGRQMNEAPPVSDANDQFYWGDQQILVNTPIDSVYRTDSRVFLIRLYGSVTSTLFESEVKQSSLDQFPQLYKDVVGNINWCTKPTILKR